MIYTDYRQRMGDLLVALVEIHTAHRLTILDYERQRSSRDPSPDIWFHMFVQEYR